ncbi:MAG: aldehyde dehydrogenase family protein [Rhodanobacteraceae bacterium]
MHQRFEEALARVSKALGGRHELFIGGKDRDAAETTELAAPFDSRLRLGMFPVASKTDVDDAMGAAQEAFSTWRATSVDERARLVRRVSDLLEERVYDIAAAMVLEVGKNRMEALGEAQEAVDLCRYYADDFESHGGYAHELPDDPIEGVKSHNISVTRPHGPWVVISPFNFPLALSAGPAAAALVTGNTVVLKGSEETPWTNRLFADCIRDAALPNGVFSYLAGDSVVGELMVGHPLTAGVTFTGSAEVGRHLIQQMSQGPWPRPCIAEMGGKNSCIVTEHANLDDAAVGIVRSAYGLSGQKCSALSRLYVQESVADALIDRLRKQIAAIRIGDPRQRENWMGPVVNATAYGHYQQYVGDLKADGATMLAGGNAIGEGSRGPAELSHGHFVEPALIETPLEHRLWKQEMFVPILMLHRYSDRDEAMRLANDSHLGLTAGFYGGADEVSWFNDNIEAGVTYANRPQGATTGSWPGYQPFGGWKSSSSTGKAIASFYYLAQYLREQSRTVVE